MVNRYGVGPGRTGEHAEGGRLAGAVHAQQPEALARAHAQPQVRDRAQRPPQRALVVAPLQALRQHLAAAALAACARAPRAQPSPACSPTCKVTCQGASAAPYLPGAASLTAPFMGAAPDKSPL